MAIPCSDVCLTFFLLLHSLFRPNASRRLASDVFITQVLFLAIYTLINEFFLFFSFSLPPRSHTFLLQFPLRDYYGPLASCPRKVPLLILALFLTAITNSHDNPPSSTRTRFNFSHSGILFHSWALSVLLAAFFAHEQTSSPSLRFPTIPSPRRYSRTRALHHEHSVLAHVCVNKIPDKPPNLFAGNCPQILAGK